jgi:hypothetical protein
VYGLNADARSELLDDGQNKKTAEAVFGILI